VPIAGLEIESPAKKSYLINDGYIGNIGPTDSLVHGSFCILNTKRIPLLDL